MTTDSDNAGQRQNGRFAPGHSGNPAGMKRGTRHRATRLAEKLMADDIKDVVNAVVAAAKERDMTAARLILDRIAPPCREAPVEIDLPPLEKISDTPRLLSLLLAAVARGELTPGEAEKMAGLVSGYTNAEAAEDAEHKEFVAGLVA